MVALCIGVSDANPLPYLGGALNGARDFRDWAKALGYEAQLLIDKEEPVTLATLRRELETLLSGPEIHRMVLYFAGHGVIREAEEGLWLLSDWSKELRAVAVEVLKRRLYKYNVGQIAIFADACRSLPASIDVADLVADGVLGRGPAQPPTTPPIDKFIAAQDGTSTYMIPGPTPEKDRCLFSGVLLEGLWGTKPAAFSKLVQGKITSRSLGAYLQSEVPEVAKRYRSKLNPNVSPTFPEGDDIYFELPPAGGPPLKPPPFDEWPPAPVGPRMGVEHLFRAEDAGGGRHVHVESVEFGDDHHEDIVEIEFGKSLLEQLQTQPRPQAFETGAGFAAEGAPIAAVWTPADVYAERHGQPNWWRLRESADYRLIKPAPVLIEFSDGKFAAVTALPEFIASILCDPRGVSALIYREIYAPPEIAASTERAIAAMEVGALRADTKTDLAVELRQAKHADPVRGVISAYLYDSMGDIDSIRRMAYYYTQHSQPIPYDIALLAQLQGEWRDGLLWAKVPAVPSREPRTEAEKQFSWTHSATAAAEGVVGGLWPWMRQGWAFLDDPADDGSPLIVPALIELREHLTTSRFTTFDATGGLRLAGQFQLVRRLDLANEPVLSDA